MSNLICSLLFVDIRQEFYNSSLPEIRMTIYMIVIDVFALSSFFRIIYSIRLSIRAYRNICRPTYRHSFYCLRALNVTDFDI